MIRFRSFHYVTKENVCVFLIGWVESLVGLECNLALQLLCWVVWQICPNLSMEDWNPLCSLCVC